MSISANTLFHFTLKDRLQKILSKGFQASYSKEDIRVVTPLESRIREAYIPMICFCDLPFHQILPHLNFYGHYGIGMRKESWGMIHGICPVHYIPDASISSFTINSLASKINSFKRHSNLPDYTGNLYDVYKLVKPYTGKVLKRKEGVPSRGNRKEKRIFYDEREWRYCPPNFPILPCTLENELHCKNANLELTKEKLHLTFKAEDVKYIIVKTEDEIMEFAKFIELNTKSKVKSTFLISKLISVEQIKSDF